MHIWTIIQVRQLTFFQLKGGRELGAGAFLESLRRLRIEELSGRHSQLSEGVSQVEQHIRHRQDQQQRRQQQQELEQRQKQQLEEQQRRQQQQQQQRNSGSGGGQRQKQQQSSSSSSRWNNITYWAMMLFKSKEMKAHISLILSSWTVSIVLTFNKHILPLRAGTNLYPPSTEELPAEVHRVSSKLLVEWDAMPECCIYFLRRFNLAANILTGKAPDTCPSKKSRFDQKHYSESFSKLPEMYLSKRIHVALLSKRMLW